MDIFSYKLGQKRGGGSGGGGGGGSVRLQNKTFNANGTYKADAGYDGLGTVKVAVPEAEAVLQDKTITANGTYTADAEYDGLGTVRVDVEAKLQNKTATANGSYTADSGFDGLGTVIVSVPEKEAVLEDKTITENGTYTAAAGYDGLGTVTVDVAGSGGIASGVSWDEVDSNSFIANATIYGDVVPRLAFYENRGLMQVTLPEGLTCINYGAFYNCSALQLTRLPDSVTHIKERAFYGCTNNNIEKIPRNVQVIEVGGFTGNRVQTVTFEGTPTSVTNCFGGCNKLTVINVPWAEGEVEGAPWGATKATINYNYTGA